MTIHTTPALAADGVFEVLRDRQQALAAAVAQIALPRGYVLEPDDLERHAHGIATLTAAFVGFVEAYATDINCLMRHGRNLDSNDFAIAVGEALDNHVTGPMHKAATWEREWDR